MPLDAIMVQPKTHFPPQVLLFLVALRSLYGLQQPLTAVVNAFQFRSNVKNAILKPTTIPVLLSQASSRARRRSTLVALNIGIPSEVTNELTAVGGVINEKLTMEQQQMLQQGLRLVPETWSTLPAQAKVALAASPLLPVANWLFQCVKTEKNRPTENTYPEATAATYELSQAAFVWENPFLWGDSSLAAKVRPLLKQTQLEYRPLRIAYSGNRDGYYGRTFHQKVDGQGAAIVLAKAENAWFGGYNPRGWASLGGSRPSRASFLFYQKGGPAAAWQKLRCLGGGGMSCGNDLFDSGIYMGAEGLVIPLNGGGNIGGRGGFVAGMGRGDRSVRSRLGTYFETGPEDRGTLLPRAGLDANLQELYVLVGVYDSPDDIPNSGGVLDLGLY